jgi:hypothetical protein
MSGPAARSAAGVKAGPKRLVYRAGVPGRTCLPNHAKEVVMKMPDLVLLVKAVLLALTEIKAAVKRPGGPAHRGRVVVFWGWSTPSPLAGGSAPLRARSSVG